MHVCLRALVTDYTCFFYGFFLFEERFASDVCGKQLTQTVSGGYVDLEDSHAAPSDLSKFTFDDNLSSNTCSVIP